jgi:hypothetical protein
MIKWLAFLFCVLLVGCSGPVTEPSASVVGELRPGLTACVSSVACGDAGICSSYEGGDGGSFCAAQPCSVLICPDSTECLCLWKSPPICGCSKVRRQP